MNSISSASTLKSFVGKQVKLKGRPVNDKAGATLILKDGAVVYLDGIPAWPTKNAEISEFVVEGRLIRQATSVHGDQRAPDEQRSERWIVESPHWYLPNSKFDADPGTLYKLPDGERLVSIRVIREHIVPGKTTRRETQEFLEKLRKQNYWLQPRPNSRVDQIQFSVQEGYVVDIVANWGPDSKVTDIVEHH